MKCTCGGEVAARPREIPKGLIKGPRRSKNRRIRKKQLKRWAYETAPLVALHQFIRSALKPTYVCQTCGRSQGFYHTIARSMFAVEPMLSNSAVYYYEYEYNNEPI